jgi:pilus assembly protein Flp/PilA
MRLINEALLRMVTWMHREKGQTLVEYGLIVALISVVAIAVLTLTGTNIVSKFTSVVTALGG